MIKSSRTATNGTRDEFVLLKEIWRQGVQCGLHVDIFILYLFTFWWTCTMKSCICYKQFLSALQPQRQTTITWVLLILKKTSEYDVYEARSEVIRSVLLSMIEWIYGHSSIWNINGITVVGKSKLCSELRRKGANGSKINSITSLVLWWRSQRQIFQNLHGWIQLVRKWITVSDNLGELAL